MDDLQSILEIDEGEWFDSPTAALEAGLAKIDAELPQWIREAQADLASGDVVNRTGGVLRLAVLLRHRGNLCAAIAVWRNYQKPWTITP